MNERIEKVVKSVKTTWESQDKKHRAIYLGLAASLVVIIIAAIIITANLNKKEYITIYQGLETTEASEMVAIIQGLNYDVRLINGTDIAVLAGTENDIIMQLALQEYPKSGTNYALSTTQTGMFTTESERELYEQIDVQRRLEAQLGKMENIASAEVNIAVPKQKNTVISAVREYPTASVKVTLDGIEKLSNKQITGIKNLVKMTVTGLTDDNVEIVDNYGIPQIINLEADYDQVLEETKKYAFKTRMEEDIENSILKMLIPAYGEDGAYVAVRIGLLNSDSHVQENVDYSADGNGNTGVLSHADGSDASGGDTVMGGVVGVEGNADDTYPTGNTAGNGAWSENSFSNTYLVDTFKEQIEKDGYRIEDLSVSVVVYTDYLAEEIRLSLVDAAGKAASIRPEFYDDLVSVINLPKFEDGFELEPTVPTYLFGLTFNQLVLVGAILLILLIALFVVMAIISGNAKKKRKEFEKQIIETSGLVGTDGEEPVDMFVLTDPETGVEVPSLTDEQIETKEVVIRREITEFANHSPEIVAQLLKSWIKSEED